MACVDTFTETNALELCLHLNGGTVILTCLLLYSLAFLFEIVFCAEIESHQMVVKSFIFVAPVLCQGQGIGASVSTTLF